MIWNFPLFIIIIIIATRLIEKMDKSWMSCSKIKINKMTETMTIQKRHRKCDEPGFSSMPGGVIEVCYSSVVIELHKALNYSQVHHFFGFP